MGHFADEDNNLRTEIEDLKRRWGSKKRCKDPAVQPPNFALGLRVVEKGTGVFSTFTR